MIELPTSYYLSIMTFAGLMLFGASQWSRPWALPYITVLGTVAAWYFLEPFYFPDLFALFESEYIDTAYRTVLIFLISFAVITPFAAVHLRPKPGLLKRDDAFVSAEQVFLAVTSLWLFLLAYGTLRMRGDLLGALFPLGGRSAGQMWSRAAGADAGSDGFIISTAGYLYGLCIAAFGLLYFFLPSGRYRALAIVLILISWPYAFLQGSRNITLATVLPGIVSYVLFSRQSFWVKIPCICIVFMALDLAFKIMIEYRNVGFGDVNLSDAEGAQHQGLNMASELVYAVKFLNEGTLQLNLGSDYFAEVANIVPRAIWSNKPLIGIDYAIARGFGGGDSDIGVFATIAFGLIGQGVQAFGIFLGPIFVALLMSIWVGVLARFRTQHTPLRLSLYLIGLGLTFNLGRGFTLLVLWPLVFGYAGVRVIEWRARQKASAQSSGFGRQRSARHASPVRPGQRIPPRD
ncbi:hypothetical protein [Labrys monachus]|uniref:Oligosaccharide repeat unit polymerase n=1 Tax=Labrys monachus TaxID=217067 RepID=A0ABU0FJJ7_9HYPH|nr:hypothetical protein [Labrys monachus]MDQ0394783.1 hypothetical protein [Labrys monachus]